MDRDPIENAAGYLRGRPVRVKWRRHRAAGALPAAANERFMFTHRRTVRIEWGDCDPAGIVFYPRYFAMFDHSTVLLIEAALGKTKHELYRDYDFGGYPMVETRARFLKPTRYCDDVVIDTAVASLGRSSLALTHRLTRDGALAVEGSETRVWVVRDSTRPGGFRPQPIPDDVRARLGASRG
jgi:4-hydroxybenzoyl-CoA thioesterase